MRFASLMVIQNPKEYVIMTTHLVDYSSSSFFSPSSKDIQARLVHFQVMVDQAHIQAECAAD